MCGYCTEIIGIDNIVLQEFIGKNPLPESDEDWMTIYFLAMESTNLFGCFQKLGGISHKDLSVILFSRSIEALVKHGFDSELYQQLISHQAVQQIFQSFNSRDMYFDPRLLKEGSTLAGLLTPEFAQSNEKVESCLKDLNRLAADCGDFLSKYVKWWCLGSGLRGQEIKITRMDPNENKEESESDDDGLFRFTTEADEEQLFQFDMAPEEKELFYSIFPYLTFALATSRKYRLNYEAIFSVITSQTRGPVDIIALDLWAQRMAIVAYYDFSGIDQFIPYNPSIRSILLYYLALKRSLPKGEIRRVREAMVAQEPLDDNYLWVKDWFLENQ